MSNNECSHGRPLPQGGLCFGTTQPRTGRTGRTDRTDAAAWAGIGRALGQAPPGTANTTPGLSALHPPNHAAACIAWPCWHAASGLRQASSPSRARPESSTRMPRQPASHSAAKEPSSRFRCNVCSALTAGTIPLACMPYRAPAAPSRLLALASAVAQARNLHC